MKDTVKTLKNKGQALVEFVLLLPVIFLILFIIFDMATIFYNKNHLEGILEDVCSMVEQGYNKNDIIKKIDNNDIEYTISIKDNFATIKLEQEIDLTTPFANSVIVSPVKIKTQRVILYE